jgi:hypothetical protein
MLVAANAPAQTSSRRFAVPQGFSLTEVETWDSRKSTLTTRYELAYAGAPLAVITYRCMPELQLAHEQHEPAVFVGRHRERGHIVADRGLFRVIASMITMGGHASEEDAMTIGLALDDARRQAFYVRLDAAGEDCPF